MTDPRSQNKKVVCVSISKRFWKSTKFLRSSGSGNFLLIILKIISRILKKLINLEKVFGNFQVWKVSGSGTINDYSLSLGDSIPFRYFPQICGKLLDGFSPSPV
jgi:hypothetical protein